MWGARAEKVALAVLCLLIWCIGKAEGGSFCELCEWPEESGVSSCECYQFCCANGHAFDNPSVCALMREGAKCDDPCAHCAELHSELESQEACFQQCCRVDYFAESCRAWRFSAAEIFVSGTKVITDRRITPEILAGRALSPASSQATANKPQVNKNSNSHIKDLAVEDTGDEDPALSLLATALKGVTVTTEAESRRGKASSESPAAIAAGSTMQEDKQLELPCSYVDSSCDEYCRGFDRPHEPIHTTCPREALEDGACGGWACSHTSRSRAQDGCFCCCSRLTDTNPEKSGKADGSGDGSEEGDDCSIGHDGNSCADFCAAHSPYFMPLTCSEHDTHNSHCGGHVCQVADHNSAQSGCFCCCADPTNEWQKVRGDALPHGGRPSNTNSLTTAVVEQPEPLDGCPASDECADYCSGFGAYMDIHSVCHRDENGDKRDHCGGWACENTSSSRAADGCFCCCSSGDNSAKSDDPCEVGHANNKCKEFCEGQHPDFMTFSCPVSGGNDGACGGHTCAAKSETEAQDGCYCCCASDGVVAGDISGDSAPDSDVMDHRASRNDVLDILALALSGKGTQTPEGQVAASFGPMSPDKTTPEATTVAVAAEPAKPVGSFVTVEKGQCEMTEDCSSFCNGFQNPLAPIRAVCPSTRGSTSGLTCAGWGCSYASKSAGPDGCTCCCSNYGMVRNADSCSVGAKTGSCLAFCASFMNNYVPLSCKLEVLTGSGPSVRCGGSHCVESSQLDAQDGCFCCCANGN